MTTVAHEHQRWVIQPLLDAGLDLEEVRELVVRLGSDPDGTGACLTGLVSDRPPEVRAAWIEVIDRMIWGDPRAVR